VSGVSTCHDGHIIALDNDNSTVSKERCDLIIGIMSAPRNFEHRDALRKTWLQNHRTDFCVKWWFLVGQVDEQPLEDKLHNEAETYKDLFRTTFFDTYSHLTTKLAFFILTIEKRYDFDLMMKADDDTYVDLNQVMNELVEMRARTSFPSHQSSACSNLYWGFIFTNMPVIHSHSHKNFEFFLTNLFPRYASGAGGYLLGWNLVKPMADKLRENELIMYNNEDASVGLWLQYLKSKYDLNVDYRFDERFDPYKCHPGQLTISSLLPNQFAQYAKQLQNNVTDWCNLPV